MLSFWCKVFYNQMETNKNCLNSSTPLRGSTTEFRTRGWLRRLRLSLTTSGRERCRSSTHPLMSAISRYFRWRFRLICLLPLSKGGLCSFIGSCLSLKSTQMWVTPYSSGKTSCSQTLCIQFWNASSRDSTVMVSESTTSSAKSLSSHLLWEAPSKSAMS